MVRRYHKRRIEVGKMLPEADPCFLLPDAAMIVSASARTQLTNGEISVDDMSFHIDERFLSCLAPNVSFESFRFNPAWMTSTPPTELANVMKTMWSAFAPLRVCIHTSSYKNLSASGSIEHKFL